VGDEAASLHRENKARRSQRLPVGKSFFLGQAIEAVIDLNRVEFAGVPGEHLDGGKAQGIKISNPVLVMPAGGADVCESILLAHGKGTPRPALR